MDLADFAVIALVIRATVAERKTVQSVPYVKIVVAATNAIASPMTTLTVHAYAMAATVRGRYVAKPVSVDVKIARLAGADKVV